MDIRNVSRGFSKDGEKSVPVLRHTSLRLHENEIVSLLGRSGSGKSTLIRLAAGLIRPDSGTVTCNDLPVEGPCRYTGMVFQNFALFPWLTVFGNVALGLQALGISREETERRAVRMIKLIGLADYLHAYPKELSGGMRQRVGFARALAVEPLVLLMDEPFSALDISTGKKLRQELMSLWEQREIATRSMVMVTHDVEEAVLLSDRVCILSGTPGFISDTFSIDIPRAERTRESVRAEVSQISRALESRIESAGERQKETS